MKHPFTTRTRLPGRFRPGRGVGSVEVLIVVAIICALILLILAVINPQDQRFKEARDSRRLTESDSILTAILSWQVDRKAAYGGEDSAPIRPSDVYAQVIVSDDQAIDCADMAQRPGCDQPLIIAPGKKCVVNIGAKGPGKLIPDYLPAMPLDSRDRTQPAACSSMSGCRTKGDLFYGPRNSGYYLRQLPSGNIEVGACKPELLKPIRVMR
jgi:hypothetical protein